ncbi:MAG: glycosyltransferase family 39 protein [Candidatus Lernaella stagnicola]|nr:glycosyltransferase family 39 protein [Candidatus Lernaella stagnicola]
MSTKTKKARCARLVGSLLIVLATLAVYARSLPGPYLWDDISLVAANRTLDDHANLPRYFTQDLGRFNQHPRVMGFYRPMQAATFHLETALFGRSAPLQRLTNVLLHALAALALYGLALTLFRRELPALLTGLLFAVHPLCTEQVCLIANRGGVMVGAFSLLTLYGIARATDEGKVDPKWLALAALAYIAALLSKPNALVLIVPAVAYLLAVGRRTEKQLVAVIALLAGLALAYAGWRWGVLGISHGHKAVTTPLWDRLLALPRLTLNAFALTLVPHRLRAIHDINLANWTSGWIVASAVAAWLLLFGAAIKVARHRPVFLLALIWFAATIAPTAGLVPLVRPVAEHYYYLPAAAGSLLWVALWSLAAERLPQRARLIPVLVLLAAFTAYTVVRAGVWASPEKLWADNVQKEPQSSEALNNYGTVLAETNRFREAYPIFERAVARQPANLKARRNRAHAAIELGLDEVAYEDLRLLLEADPCDAKAGALLGRLVVTAASLAPANLADGLTARHRCAATIHLGAAMTLQHQGSTATATSFLQRFLDAAPEHPMAPAVRRQLAEWEKIRNKNE